MGLKWTVQTNARTEPTSDNARGCLLGLAVGDVLGCPIESMSPSKIRERFGRVQDLVKTPIKNLRDTYFWRLPGLHSDDTQQALAITDILVEYGEIDENALVELWRGMAETDIIVPSARTGRLKKHKEGFGSHRGTGGGFRKRIRSITSPPASSNGDGAAMRVAPVGVKFFDDRMKRVDNAVRSALTTSSHPHAAASAAAVAASVALGSNPKPLKPEEFITGVGEETRIAEQYLMEKYSARIDPECQGAASDFSQLLEELAAWLELPLQDALNRIARHAERSLGLHDLFATKSYALTAVPTALFVSARHLNDFRAGVIEAINLGGDTDTIGAMVGGILGARNGVESIPGVWQNKIIASDQLLLRGEALLTGNKGPGWVALSDLEKKFTLREALERSRLRAKFISKM